MNRHTHMHMNGILHITWTFCQFKSGHLPISGGHQPGLVFRTTRPECRENAAPKCGDPLGSVWCFILQKCFSSLGFSKCLDLHRFSSSSGFQHHNIRIHNKSHQHTYIYIYQKLSKSDPSTAGWFWIPQLTASGSGARALGFTASSTTRDTSRLSGILDNLEGKTRTWLARWAWRFVELLNFGWTIECRTKTTHGLRLFKA